MRSLVAAAAIVGAAEAFAPSLGRPNALTGLRSASSRTSRWVCGPVGSSLRAQKHPDGFAPLL